jgi:hypothetical protein
MSDAAFLAAVSRVLSALHLEPATFAPPPGFACRVRRLARPRTLVLDARGRESGQRLVVHVGKVEAEGPEAAQPAAVELALAALTDVTRAECQDIVVVWEDAETTHAAAFVLGATGVAKRLAASWIEPGAWQQPMIDAGLPPAQALDAAQRTLRERLLAVAADRSGVDAAWAVLGQALRRIGGEPLDGRPPAAAPLVLCERWLAHVELAVADERRRVGVAPPAAGAAMPQPGAGPLAGISVFVSYARPDAAQLAWPVRDALAELGADVWLDQERPPSAADLDRGLAESIAGCDAYLMCASNEFLERAGYAMQELAWAMAHSAASRLRTVVVAEAGVVLPTAVQHWPRIAWVDEPAPTRAARFVAAIKAPAARQPMPTAPAPAVRRDAWPPLRRRVDPIGAALRGLHAERLREFPDDEAINRRSQRRGRFLHVAEGLGWSGRLADVGAGRADGLVRSLRWRLGALAALAAFQWPLADGADTRPVMADLHVLIDRQLPFARWPASTGWAAFERRLLLRWQAGLLRLLQDLLERGLFGGLPTLDAATDARWRRLLPQRRAECLDAMLAMRLGGELGWAADPPAWDEAFVELKRVFETSPSLWHPACPPALTLRLALHRDALASALADVAWHAMRHPRLVRCAMELMGPEGPIEVRFTTDAVVAPPHSNTPAVEFAIERELGGGAQLALRWNSAWPGGPGAAAQSWPQRARLAWASA